MNDLLEQFNIFGSVQAAGVGLVGVHMDDEPRGWVDADVNVIEGCAGRSADAKLHQTSPQ